MKNKMLTLLIALIACHVLPAQVPQAINYQAIARSSSGQEITNQTIGIRFSIRDNSAVGTVVYRETNVATTNPFGLFTTAVGTGTAVTGSFSAINWGAASKYLQVEIDVTGGTNYTDMGTSQLLSVPYAMYAASAANLQYQTLSISKDTLYLTNGGFVKLPSAVTLGGFVLPELQILPASSITSNTAKLQASIINLNGNRVTEWGICYDTLPHPVLTDKKMVSSSSSSFTFHLSGDSAYLHAGKTYYARPYAITENNVYAYGNEITFSTLAVGQPGPGGGVVIFDKGIYTNGWRYLEAAPAYTPDNWGCWNTLVGTTTDSLGAGPTNTNAILSVCPFAYAALGCSNYVLASVTDWFLPSKEEARAFRNLGNLFPDSYLWTSSEISATQAWSFEANTFNVVAYNKTGGIFTYYIPVRRY